MVDANNFTMTIIPRHLSQNDNCNSQDAILYNDIDIHVQTR